MKKVFIFMLSLALMMSIAILPASADWEGSGVSWREEYDIEIANCLWRPELVYGAFRYSGNVVPEIKIYQYTDEENTEKKLLVEGVDYTLGDYVRIDEGAEEYIQEVLGSTAPQQPGEYGRYVIGVPGTEYAELDLLATYWIWSEEQVAELNYLPFTDVAYFDWYYGAVAYAYEYSLFNGTSETTFSPNDTMTCAMMVQVLYNMGGNGETFDAALGGPWYANAVIWAENNALVQDIPNFDPEKNASREQMAVLMRNYAVAMDIQMSAVREVVTFADADQVSDWAKEALDAMYASNVLNGKENGRFDPQGSATRAEVATMFMNFYMAMD